MKLDCKIDLKLTAEFADAKTLKVATFLNGEHCLSWQIPLDKFQNEKVLTITEIL